jgi:hypothetical protein
MIPICMPLSLTLCMNARDYTTERTKVKDEGGRMKREGPSLPFILHPSPCILLSVEPVLADIARHGFWHQLV